MSSNPESAAESGGWLWWLKLLQVRLRFVLLTLLGAATITQWSWLTETWHGLVSGAAGFGHRHEVAAGYEYFCPMDPGVLSAWPAICPICSMDLVPRRQGDVQLLPEGVFARMQLSPHRVQLAGLRVSSVDPVESAASAELLNQPQREVLGTETLLSVPASSIIHHGNQSVVYLQTMPGMFDGVPVTCGPSMGDRITILAGLEAGQQVVSAGAFLVDAESRLNPALATGYFGASQAAPTETSSLAAPKTRTSATRAATLSAADQQLADQQKICPVTKLPLDSMGGPVPVMVGDRRVLICCKSCEKPLQRNPEKYFGSTAAAEAQSPAAETGRGQ